MKPLRFVVIADSHIRSPRDDLQTYPSNGLMVARNEHVVALCNRIDAAFVVHLGDIVHPLPVESAHEPAVRLAARIYTGLHHPIHFVPGNHDVGDKPNALVAVPPVADENYGIFEHYWGPPYRSFDVGACHFVIVDTPVLNSGLDREKAQRSWLEADLVASHRLGKRSFLFTHYPPFIRDRDEFEHYDNLAEPGRTWLLDLVVAHGVEAVFSGHVHNFLYNRHGDADLYVLPSTGFVRPDYSELAAIAPEREAGRDDLAKLGFFVVDVTRDGHTVRPIRTGGVTAGDGGTVPLEVAVEPSWSSPVGVTVRHGWDSEIDFPTAGLDEFNRKTVRNDAWVPALWEARIGHVRIPLADVATPRGRERARDLAHRGLEFSVRSGGVPTRRHLEAVSALDGVATRWEIATPTQLFASVVDAVSSAEIPESIKLAMAPIEPLGDPGTAVHHFVTAGFDPHGGAPFDELLASDVRGVFGDVVFRIPPGMPILDGAGVASNTAAEAGRTAMVIVELPRAGEAEVFSDDGAVAEVVAGSVAAARSHPDVSVFLDGFVDHDRGYYRRHGLIDRRSNPRHALRRLIEESTGRNAPSGRTGHVS